MSDVFKMCERERNNIIDLIGNFNDMAEVYGVEPILVCKDIELPNYKFLEKEVFTNILECNNRLLNCGFECVTYSIYKNDTVYAIIVPDEYYDKEYRIILLRTIFKLKGGTENGNY